MSDLADILKKSHELTRNENERDSCCAILSVIGSIAVTLGFVTHLSYTAYQYENRCKTLETENQQLNEQIKQYQSTIAALESKVEEER